MPVGNEEYNAQYVEQVAALEAKAKALGVGSNQLYYLFPQNRGVNNSDGPKAKALGLGDHLVADEHTGANGGVASAKSLFANNNTDDWGSINLETNCGDHTHRRALEEASDLNTFFNFPDSRQKGRAASFCMERSGFNEAGLNDQGMIFFLPNMTWGQPPFYVHAMVTDTWLDNALVVNMSSGCSGGRRPRWYGPPEGFASAQQSVDGTKTVVRIVNNDPVSRNITVNFPPSSGAGAVTSTTTSVLSWPELLAANTPGNPTKISPQSAAAQAVAADGSMHVTVPAQAYMVVQLG